MYAPKHRAERQTDACTCKVTRPVICDIYEGRHRWTGADR